MKQEHRGIERPNAPWEDYGRHLSSTLWTLAKMWAEKEWGIPAAPDRRKAIESITDRGMGVAKAYKQCTDATHAIQKNRRGRNRYVYNADRSKGVLLPEGTPQERLQRLYAKCIRDDLVVTGIDPQGRCEINVERVDPAVGETKVEIRTHRPRGWGWYTQVYVKATLPCDYLARVRGVSKQLQGLHGFVDATEVDTKTRGLKIWRLKSLVKRQGYAVTMGTSHAGIWNGQRFVGRFKEDIEQQAYIAKLEHDFAKCIKANGYDQRNVAWVEVHDELRDCVRLVHDGKWHVILFTSRGPSDGEHSFKFASEEQFATKRGALQFATRRMVKMYRIGWRSMLDPVPPTREQVLSAKEAEATGYTVAQAQYRRECRRLQRRQVSMSVRLIGDAPACAVML